MAVNPEASTSTWSGGTFSGKVLVAAYSILQSTSADIDAFLRLIIRGVRSLVAVDGVQVALLEPGGEPAPSLRLRVAGTAALAGGEGAAAVAKLRAAARSQIAIWSDQGALDELGITGEHASVCWMPIHASVGPSDGGAGTDEGEATSVELGGIYLDTRFPTPALHRAALLEVESLAEVLGQVLLIRDLYLIDSGNPLRRGLNRSALLRLLARLLAAGGEQPQELSLALFSVDGMREINRSAGYRAGDLVLASVAAVIPAGFPATAIVGHYGGARLAVVVPGAEGGAVFRAAQKMVDTVRRRFAATPAPVTVSAGVVGREDPQDLSTEAFLAAAASALEAAQSGGGDRAVRFGAEQARALKGTPATGPLDWLPGRDLGALISMWELLTGVSTRAQLREVLGKSLLLLLHLMRADRACVYAPETDRGAQRLALVAGRTRSGEVLSSVAPLPELVDDVVKTGQPRLVSPPAGSGPTAVRAGGTGAAAEVAVPLAGDTEVRGALYVAATSAGELQVDGNALALLARLGRCFARAMEHAGTMEAALTSKERERQRLRAENEQLRELIRSATDLIAADPAMLQAIERVRRVARSDAAVLILGESGTGKEALCRLLHRASARANQPFVVVDCGAIPEQLLESELFGHEAGAFTGADRRRLGRFEEAQGGTIFLDEVGDLPLVLQVKLLRVLQHKTIRRLGGKHEIAVDFRLVAATHRDLERMAMEGAFRQDLYYRLSVVPIAVPPLRKRGDDILLLGRHFATQFAREAGLPPPAFSEALRAAVLAYRWPGNVRELQNRINRAVLLAERPVLEPADLGFPVGGEPIATAAMAGQSASWAPETEVETAAGAAAKLAPGATVPDLDGAVGAWVRGQWLPACRDLAPPMDHLGAFLMLESVKAACGRLSGAARLIGLGRTAFLRQMERLDHPELAAAIESHGVAQVLRGELRRRRPDQESGHPGLFTACERAVVGELARHFNGNQVDIARAMGCHPSTICRMLRRKQER
ncbi:MAG: sigma 54-interacting transcriptional regulator [Candidatus Schekmanbacteria bacterium]|nr:sigma 54-interacting transcriptional regulator [Candidatus Schekmanbacteria bacterium]